MKAEKNLEYNIQTAVNGISKGVLTSEEATKSILTLFEEFSKAQLIEFAEGLKLNSERWNGPKDLVEQFLKEDD